ncbi:hypothetical protein E2C01_049407 [Portunus trituberculatus]|uniref:Uncharacterized protein n=1 Tax=Portunus trituberculatus TaxID=210409 RepID=A0A5B7G5G3_PORTR|nr:hypothetical protein [Portunus trituberculatus]
MPLIPAKFLPLIEDSEESLSSLSDDPHGQKEQENDSGGIGEESTDELSEGEMSADQSFPKELQPAITATQCPLKMAKLFRSDRQRLEIREMKWVEALHPSGRGTSLHSTYR